MLNNYIGGGQVFLHNMRMLRQVVSTTIFVSAFSGALLAWSFNSSSSNKVDWDGALTYVKASSSLVVHPALSMISIGKPLATIDAYSKGKIWHKRMLASSVVESNKFKSAWREAFAAIKQITLQSLGFGMISGLMLMILWSKFGKNLKSEKKTDGKIGVLTDSEVRNKLLLMRKISKFKIGKMPLVKDMETRHFLVTGSTGSGKTNLLHNLMPQIERHNQPAIVIDQTGEMIAKYYDKDRGDIIFNPFDARGMAWDFWADCSSREELRKFAKILIGFNRKSSGSQSDPFWENAAETVFSSVAEYLRPEAAPIEKIYDLVSNAPREYLESILKNTEASRYLTKDGKQTVASVLSVLAANTQSLSYLSSDKNNGSFSVAEYFQGVEESNPRWLFLATKPGSRALTLPLISAITELALSRLMNLGANKERRVWTIIDELPALGRLPALAPLMAEGRKYGACVIAGLQSLNQLYEKYGSYAGSAIFGQFGTSFFFRSTEPAIAKMISESCGSETITRQQKNTSFGANTFRDGISYSEQEKKRPLVDIEDLASLGTGQCYVLSSEPEVRLAKIKAPEAKVKDKNEGFIEKDIDGNSNIAGRFFPKQELRCNGVQSSGFSRKIEEQELDPEFTI